MENKIELKLMFHDSLGENSAGLCCNILTNAIYKFIKNSITGETETIPKSNRPICVVAEDKTFVYFFKLVLKSGSFETTFARLLLHTYQFYIKTSLF